MIIIPTIEQRNNCLKLHYILETITQYEYLWNYDGEPLRVLVRHPNAISTFPELLANVKDDDTFDALLDSLFGDPDYLFFDVFTAQLFMVTSRLRLLAERQPRQGSMLSRLMQWFNDITNPPNWR